MTYFSGWASSLCRVFFSCTWQSEPRLKNIKKDVAWESETPIVTLYSLIHLWCHNFRIESLDFGLANKARHKVRQATAAQLSPSNTARDLPHRFGRHHLRSPSSNLHPYSQAGLRGLIFSWEWETLPLCRARLKGGWVRHQSSLSSSRLSSQRCQYFVIKILEET